jgi:lipoprotein-releasing system permease protein
MKKPSSFRWVVFVALRNISRSRRNRSSASTILAILGIFTGVLALTVILAVMNGFQLSFIESIVEISSYHVRLETAPIGEEGEALARQIRELDLVAAVLPFRELQGIVRGRREGQQAAVVRGLPPDALDKDKGMAERLVFEEGSFSLDREDSVILGAELARRLAVRTGDALSFLSLSGNGIFASPVSGDEEEVYAGDSRFTVTGIFRSGFYEYDLGWAFINTNTAARLLGDDDSLSLGIKLKSRWQDNRIVGQIKQLPSFSSLDGRGLLGEIRPWRDYNRAFYGALRTEKLLMFILVGLIFIVVGLNIFQAQRRAVLERREEIGLLRAVGGGETAVRLIFVWDGFIIGLTGAGSGVALGLLVAFNITSFFTILEGLVNAGIGFLNAAASVLGVSKGGVAEGFAVFSPAVFYIKEIPSRVIPREVILIFLFGFLSALLAAWFASGKASRTKPAEVLRYE